ncbi:phosphoribosylglycinamide formyltransferase [Novosphingobium pentaromativorans]|uniref:Phosphoribosylglycinamide formyltransferase n=1 Tax=Novosphingobium pentaromativorans US6-1 TaxID=1088721 RepID=G6E7R9_9SPHN|nr:phosphoribosylglycinamide formyltransferase [Novosphingobium pentaromativorans]AIT81554.1 phosphoribosylglycinamide formyltransferase [Novosphingobium pentaromativorans US6-1]EHJ62562.1 phosphoribosylglycinamide formyltransferase [Novosphingobium pentaromativorans US6-1]
MNREKVAVLISGSGTNMAALLYASRAEDCPFEIVLVASNDPAAKGLVLAEAEGVPTFALSHKGMARAEHDKAMDAAIRESGAQWVALAGYMRILTPEFVGGWEGRMVNIHPSLLPKYTGLHTHERAIEAGDSHGGVTVHLVTAELDDGPILGQTPVAIIPGDTPDSLAARVLIAEHQLYSRCLASLVTREKSAEWLLERVREQAMAMPEADEITSHGMPCFGVIKGKKFAYFTSDHHGDGRIALLVKISGVDEQAMLLEQDEERYFRPAYFGDGWIGIRLDLGSNDWDMIAARIARSWRSIAPKRLSALQDAADQF